MKYRKLRKPAWLRKLVIISGILCLSIPAAKSDDDVAKAHKGLVHGCLQSGASTSFCTCQADEIVSHVPVSELGIFGNDFVRYIKHEIGVSDMPENYHEAIMGMASCAERFNN